MPAPPFFPVEIERALKNESLGEDHLNQLVESYIGTMIFHSQEHIDLLAALIIRLWRVEKELFPHDPNMIS